MVKRFAVLAILSASSVCAEGFQQGILPFTNSPRIGNNFTAVSNTGERFEGRAWFSSVGGFFCMSSDRTSCGGRYDAKDLSEKLYFNFQCLDGRKGKGVSNRLSDNNSAEVMYANGKFADGDEFLATMGPTKQFNKGVGCWY